MDGQPAKWSSREQPLEGGAGRSFFYEPHPVRAICSTGASSRLGTELERLGITRPMVLTTQSGAARYRNVIDSAGRIVVPYSEAQAHSPEHVSLDGLAAFLRSGCDGLVSIGGGSTTGLGKFITASTGKPLIVIPTTLAGSEMTAIYGWKAKGEKFTRVDPRAMPRTVIYDAELFRDLPSGIVVRSAMNCLAHLVEALYPESPNRFATSIAAEGIRVLVAALPIAIASPGKLGPLQDLCYAAFLGGHLVAVAGIGLHHKLCHLIGGMTDISHGDNHSAILSHVVALNAPYMGDNAVILDELFGQMPGTGLQRWAEQMGAPTALGPLGLTTDLVPGLVNRVLQQQPHNPAPLDAATLRALLEGIRTGVLADYSR